MKISVVFPSVMYREGPGGIAKLIRAFEDIGFDEMDMFDHVVMGYPTETRRAPFYMPKMPIMEAMTMPFDVTAPVVTERRSALSSPLTMRT